MISNATFEVNEKGRARVLKYGKKVVHAYVVGHLQEYVTATMCRYQVLYNPYENSTFITRKGKPVYSADLAFLSPLGVRVKFPRFRQSEI